MDILNSHPPRQPRSDDMVEHTVNMLCDMLFRREPAAATVLAVEAK